jgi:glyoxylase-like metal-dependent hydrolase (beta-lactamase superfamily II)
LPFPGGVGRTTSPENFASLLDDVTERVFAQLPDNTWFYPGHGDDSTLGDHAPTSRSGANAAGDSGGQMTTHRTAE